MTIHDTTEDEFESYVKGLDDNIESVTTCLAVTADQEKQHGLVITVKGVDVVLLQSDLEEIIEYLDSEITFPD
jgi:predicted house-cleaning NTP pyrophosphatase (Maf/HAM1 superfamily)